MLSSMRRFAANAEASTCSVQSDALKDTRAAKSAGVDLPVANFFFATSVCPCSSSRAAQSRLCSSTNTRLSCPCAGEPNWSMLSSEQVSVTWAKLTLDESDSNLSDASSTTVTSTADWAGGADWAALPASCFLVAVTACATISGVRSLHRRSKLVWSECTACIVYMYSSETEKALTREGRVDTRVYTAN
eukprot:scaffold6029_cov63-Phaeocystis_antarctica.AAC.3